MLCSSDRDRVWTAFDPPLQVKCLPTMKDWIELRERQELIASFGGAEIVKNLDGTLEIRGGTQDEQERAYAWMHQFLMPPLLSQEQLT